MSFPPPLQLTCLFEKQNCLENLIQVMNFNYQMSFLFLISFPFIKQKPHEARGCQLATPWSKISSFKNDK